MRGTVALLFMLTFWLPEPAAAAAPESDIHSEVGNSTLNVDEIQDYNTQTAPEVCHLSICELLLRELGTMREMMSGMEARLQASETKVAVMESELQESKREIEQLKMGAGKVAFAASVGGHGNTGPYDVQTTLEYKNVLTNVGDAYNPATGIFVAPVNGIYYFNFCYHAGQQKGTIISLYKNSEMIATTSHHGHESSSANENGSNGVALQLEEGDQIYVELSAETWVWDGSAHDTVFTGFLVTGL